MESLPPQTLARLCQQTLPEDTRAFEALVGQLKARVYATAYRLMGNRQDAEDQAQEVFVKVYPGIHSPGDSSLEGLGMVVALQRVVSGFRPTVGLHPNMRSSAR
ncbi:MAG TPA: sigma factor [Chloroflexota bacterium]|nr:sigma factor [Chloroflexota bacterium]